MKISYTSRTVSFNLKTESIMTIYAKIAIEWCLFLFAAVIEIIWHSKCVCNNILKICSVVDDHLAHQEQCHSIKKPCCTSTSCTCHCIYQNSSWMVFVCGCWCDRNYLALQICWLFCCNVIIYNVCLIFYNNNSAYTFKTQTACIYASSKYTGF